MRARPRLLHLPAASALALTSTLVASACVLTALPGHAADSLLSQGRPATSSSHEDATLDSAGAFDGDPATRWASAEGHDPEWLRVDLGASATLSRVKLTWEAAYGKAYRIETSPDGSTWTTVYSTTAGDGGTDDLTLSGTGRYVRMYGTARGTAYGYSLYEMEVYGHTGGASPTPTITPTTGGPGVPFGSHKIPYVAGMLRPSGAQATLDQKVVDYYRRWKSAFVKQNCGNGWYQIISPDADHPYVAEAQGYGMVITATMAGADPDAKKIFDGLLKYVLAHPSSITPGLLAAEQDASCKSVNGSDSATDGDLDVAYGLLLADRQWGSSGTYNYKKLAVDRINAIKAGEVNPTTKLMKLGDWTSAGDEYYWISRSSDWMIDHFRAFRKATGDATWDTVRVNHQNLIASQQATYAPNTGLLADFVVDTNTTPKPAPKQVLEDPNDGKYWWNACRDPWRIGDDAVTSGDAKSLAAARKLNTWIKSKTGGDPNKIGIGYSLGGSQISSGSEPAYFAPFAVAAMTDPGSQAWLDALWNKMLNAPFTSDDYFSTSIQLQVMITVTGNHWVP
ncbi:endo-1,4-beta-D-glucanase Y [Streptosporangium becharense]|uniref:Endo-1,4-beta-D-glucanase Y n=1 Tax=Streptosporangium becharense TaxID=1816182 RepID=A0A7W9MFL9_9ACTN|nr:glycosyl hydrolase family 8 [Streptosporangium becharense]MBB2909853.1 endo-1,4-beta-D-glucanase Y [Streptosporangium becharense]MBB5819192.1 endo-1,4-beta-D-glucanase Y [Streptosporangium becharense]